MDIIVYLFNWSLFFLRESHLAVMGSLANALAPVLTSQGDLQTFILTEMENQTPDSS